MLPAAPPSLLIRRHLVWGWGGLLAFIVLGVLLEGFHAFKAPFYLDAENETRRLLWRLAHAHGALLSLLQIGGAFSLAWLEQKSVKVPGRLISRALLGAQLVLPTGFFFAGCTAKGGDPGVAIVLVPAGAVLLIAGAALLFVSTLRAR